MRRILSVLVILSLALPMCANAEAALAARCRLMGETADTTVAFSYSDAWFEAPSSQYQHGLAQATLGMTVSAFRAADVELTNCDKNVRAFLSQAGFDDFVSAEYDVPPTENTIATLIGKKEIGAGQDRFTLVVVAVSGGRYGNEWLSNFTIGETGAQVNEHLGFSQAAQQVVERTKAYVSTLQGTVKLWIGGYSRAAAVSNLAGAKLIDDHVAAPENIFVYTFATPATTRAKNAAQYPQIFNIVGSFDPVPAVPLADWGFTRFGKTLYLPAQETCTDYAAKKEAASSIHQNLLGAPFWNSPESNYVVHKVLEALYALMPTPEAYVDNYQALLKKGWKSVKSPLMLMGILKAAYDKASRTGEISELSEVMDSEAFEALLEWTGIRAGSWNEQAGIGENLFHEHYPQVYISWMLWSDSADVFVDNRAYRRIILCGPFSLEISDIELNNLQTVTAETESGQGDYAVLQLGDETIVTLPGNRDYLLAVTGMKEGTVSCEIRDYVAGQVTSRTIGLEPLEVRPDSYFYAALQKTTDQDAQIMFTDMKQTATAVFDSGAGSEGDDIPFDLLFAGNSREKLIVIFLIALGLCALLTFFGVFGIRRARKRHEAKKSIKG